MSQTGTIAVSWDADGHLNIKCSLSLNDSHGRKLAIEKLLDAARAVNNQGVSLAMPTANSTRIFSDRG
jgi:hypothetical protein